MATGPRARRCRSTHTAAFLVKNISARLPDSPNYGRIARAYRWLEYAAFGSALQRSRETFVERLGSARNIAVFGGGDGRCFKVILRECPVASIDAYDIDPVMIAFARRRIPAKDAARVTFHQADARTLTLKAASYDAVITHYFLDCFSTEELDALIPKLGASLRPGGRWLFADFAIPPASAFPFLRWRARATIAVLCWFFRWQVQHPLKQLPPIESKLHQYGWLPQVLREGSGRMVRTVLFAKFH